ncbi:hypothetical protein BOX15_Mlig002568g2 [Macrostomum lignano]|uniref:t-SNARE coiled-coil homology domain-containing protein n=1 Tax=Macrostomum lignano TaxID=282301 RepID=A0A267FCF4_9PLAT|nr:hypothetical protein BOX15_Mlig002568g3 [Macrostomum lignano]PAA71460.1 hypothetical protein BOX15_Mlig002568g1 [Macrostomum lignano]PAA89352.1 hypothetical protein BOX15_Mlig002568g2 [Macrostomum lignano]
MRRAQQSTQPQHQPYSGYTSTTTNQEQVEQENDNLTNQLRSKVSELKHLSINIGTEIRDQNGMLGNMQSDFDKSEAVLRASMAKLVHISKTVWSSNKLLVNLLLFALLVFLIIWLLYR